ncbi:hypothetical protein C8N24_0742 [Solirubrobacter pauli]|uniref:Peptidase M23-like protein n=1 Tax=Solirubrobacter pauli TaxID=166793 RepID=A0A660L7B1_9ACTN|nr:hypothetical protein C8N24_0742 [Solirubrobacter pauli]
MITYVRSMRRSQLRTLVRAVVACLAVALCCLPAEASATPERATILSPADGSLTSSPLESPPHHTPFTGDWAVDIAGAVGRPVYARFANVSGSLALNVIGRFEPCASPNQGTAGIGLRVQVSVDGVALGVVNYVHLANARGNGPVGNGEQLGTMSSGTRTSCWTGAHVHMEPRNDSKYSCFQSTPLGAGLGGGSKLGVLGGEYAAAKNQLCPPGAVDAAAGTSPRGAYDEASSPGAGTVRVRGWTYDPDAPTSTGAIHVYVGGPAGSPGAEGHAFNADAVRADVAAAFPGVGDRHGLDVTFGTGKRGAQTVCAYAINIAAGGENVGLGCKTVTIDEPNPFGNFESADSPAGGQLHVSGWATDRNAFTQPLTMHVYIGGPAGTPDAEFRVLTAGRERRDVAAAVAGAGAAHGFDDILTTARRGSQAVCVYAINVGPGENIALGCKTVTIQDPPPPTADAGANDPAPAPSAAPPDPTASPVPATAPTTAPGSARRTLARTVRLARASCSRARLRLSGQNASIARATRLRRGRCRLTIVTTAPAGTRYDLLIRRSGNTVRRASAIGV